MVSIQQVNALRKVLEHSINHFYQRKIGELEEQIEALKEEIVVDILADDADYSIHNIEIQEPYSAILDVHVSHKNFEKIEDLREEIEKTYNEWHKTQRKLETYINLLLISKDSPIDKPDLPKELEKFLSIAVDSLYREE